MQHFAKACHHATQTLRLGIDFDEKIEVMEQSD